MSCLLCVSVVVGSVGFVGVGYGGCLVEKCLVILCR